MELKEGTSVYTATGEELGKVNRFVLDPATGKVTHITVQKGWLLPEDKVVSMDMVATASDERVVLKDQVRDFDQLPPFEETHYIGTRRGEGGPADYPTGYYGPAFYWYPPYGGWTGLPATGLGTPTPYVPTETERNIPAGTVPIKEGANVLSSEGDQVGTVERVMVDPESKRATHFLIAQGMLFKDHKLVPTHWVRRVEEDNIHLGVQKNVLEQLPDYRE